MRKQSNLYTVKRYEVECLPVGGGKSEYSNAVGFGVSTSLKEAKRLAQLMYWQTCNGGTPVIGETVILKGNKVIVGQWSKNDQKTFREFYEKHLSEC